MHSESEKIKLFNPNTGKAIAFDKGRKVYRKTPFENWKHFANIKDTVELSDYLATKKNAGYRTYVEGDVPSEAELNEMLFDGIAMTTDGQGPVEPDGEICGIPAWPRALGLI